jgi:hypothetical protein
VNSLHEPQGAVHSYDNVLLSKLHITCVMHIGLAGVHHLKGDTAMPLWRPLELYISYQRMQVSSLNNLCTLVHVPSVWHINTHFM